MRVVTLSILSLLLVGPVAAQEKAGEPVGNLAQVMRAIQFPNSNLLFDVQSADPDKPPEAKEGEGASQMFSGIYKGWMVVEQAAIALAEAERIVLVPGRMCENGKPAPVDQEDFQQWARQLTVASIKTLEAARAKDRDAVIELTNEVAGACEDCHTKYRRYEDRCRQ